MNSQETAEKGPFLVTDALMVKSSLKFFAVSTIKVCLTKDDDVPSQGKGLKFD
jgi:hypothetical protein